MKRILKIFLNIVIFTDILFFVAFLLVGLFDKEWGMVAVSPILLIPALGAWLIIRRLNKKSISPVQAVVTESNKSVPISEFISTGEDISRLDSKQNTIKPNPSPTAQRIISPVSSVIRQPERKKTTNWLKVNGIFNIIAGTVFCLGGLGALSTANLILSIDSWQVAYRLVSVASIGATLGVIALVGSIQALKRKQSGLVSSATIANTLSCVVVFPIGGLGATLLLFIFLGLPALVALAKGKNQLQKNEQWESTIGGLFTLAAGIGTTIIGLVVATTGSAPTQYYGWSGSALSSLSLLVIVVGLFAIFGGTFAMIRKLRSLALLGLACSIVLFCLMVIFAAIIWSGRIVY